MFGGSGNVTRTSPFWRRLLKSLRVVADDPEVVGVDRPEQRIVGLRIEAPPPLQQLESRLDAGRGQLEAVRRHVAVGAGAAVPLETGRASGRGTPRGRAGWRRTARRRTPARRRSSSVADRAVIAVTAAAGTAAAGAHGGAASTRGRDRRRSAGMVCARHDLVRTGGSGLIETRREMRAEAATRPGSAGNRSRLRFSRPSCALIDMRSRSR